jgi:hypothetical protein
VHALKVNERNAYFHERFACSFIEGYRTVIDFTAFHRYNKLFGPGSVFELSPENIFSG